MTTDQIAFLILLADCGESIEEPLLPGPVTAEGGGLSITITDAEWRGLKALGYIKYGRITDAGRAALEGR